MGSYGVESAWVHMVLRVHGFIWCCECMGSYGVESAWVHMVLRVHGFIWC